MADATGPGPYRTSRVGFFFIALSALLFGSLGVTTKGVLTVATTNAFSITLRRAIIALPTLLAISAVILGKNMLRIAGGDLRIMVFAGLLMALYQVTFVIAITLVNVTIATLVTLCTVPVFAALLSRMLLGERLQSSIVVALPGILRHQIGDEEVRVLYPAEKLPEVARVVGARKRRSLAPATARKRSGLSTVRASASRQDRV